MLLNKLILFYFTIKCVNSCSFNKEHANCGNLYDAMGNSKILWRTTFIGSENNVPIHVFNTTILKNVHELEELIIVGQLIDIQPYSFTNYSSLKTLNLNQNNIAVLKSNCFNGLSTKMLHLTANNISNIEQASFNGTQTDLLDLSDNQLKNINKGQVNVDGLKILRIKSNELYYIEPDSFPKSLKILVLESNNLYYLDKNVLSPLTKLKILNLAHNKLNRFDRIENMMEIEEINLSNNIISVIEARAFFNFNRLKVLNLNNNFLLKLTATQLPLNSVLQKLYLANNNFTILEDAVLNKLTTLKDIKIYGNLWNCKCLRKIEVFLIENQIHKSVCEVLTVESGSVPECIVFSSECKIVDTSNYSQELEEFFNATKSFKC